MDNYSKPKIELSTSSDDWKVVRECYVRSFYRYPLYKYMVPEEEKREEFLRAYLDANYEVTVGSGQGILLAIKIPVEYDDNENIQYKVVGGVIFVPPSSDGCGWAIGDDKPYWDAYEKYRLSKISPEGLERVKRYEAWENDHVAQKVGGTRIPLWNGLFCAIQPEYTSKGVGTAVFKEAIRIMAKYWAKQQASLKAINQPKAKLEEKEKQGGILNKILGSTPLSNLHRYSLLHHRGVPPAAFAQKVAEQKKDVCEKKNVSNEKSPQTKNPSLKEMLFNPNSPMVVAISHSDRAASFHQSNGFQPVIRLPFYDEVDDITPFSTHVMVLDPFCTGRINELSESLLEKQKESKNESTPVTFYEDINTINPCSVLI